MYQAARGLKQPTGMILSTESLAFLGAAIALLLVSVFSYSDVRMVSALVSAHLPSSQKSETGSDGWSMLAANLSWLHT